MKYADRYGNRWEETGLQDRSAEPQFDSSPQCLQQKPVAFDDL